MIKLFLSCHGCMASGMKRSLDILVGEYSCLTVFDAYVSEENLADQLDSFFADSAEEDFKLLISDMYGGSVNQTMYPYAARGNTMLLSGINLPLLLELVIAAESGDLTPEQVHELVCDARETIQVVEVEETSAQDTEEDDFF